MRSTRATAAVERLKVRSGNALYSMVRTGDDLFYLVLNSDSGPSTISEQLEQDEFVKFIDSLGPQKPKRVSKLDIAFEKQLVRKN